MNLPIFTCLTYIFKKSIFNSNISSQILKEFPEELRGDVSMHLHREILQLPIFESASQVNIDLKLAMSGNFK